MANREKKVFNAAYKDRIDDFYKIVELFQTRDHFDPLLVRRKWQELDLLVSNNKEAADALHEGLTPSHLELIREHMKGDDADTIEAARKVMVTLTRAHESHDGFSLDVYAKNNLSRASVDVTTRREAKIGKNFQNQKQAHVKKARTGSLNSGNRSGIK